MTLCAPEGLVIERERAAWRRCREGNHLAEFHLGHQHGTVGAVALDQQGNIVAGTSTGGTCCKRPGRVGDSPLIGCGCYADIEAGGVSCTGWGEAIMKVVMAKTAVDFLRAGKSPQEAAQLSVELLARRGASLDRWPAGGFPASSPPSASPEPATGGLILLDRDGRPGFAFNTPRMAFGESAYCIALCSHL